ACGNAAVAVSQTITVDDQTPPVITSVPANVTVSCASLVPPADDSAVVATDNCAGTVTVSHDADVIAAGSCANRYVITRTYHATDLCGNAAVAVSQTITVDDQTPPVITSVPANVTVSCASLVPPADDSAVVATDNCAGTVTVSHDADVIAAGSCANRYVITRTYHATDLCGNAAVAVSQTITVDDQTPPVITSVPANVTVSCASLVPPADDSAVVATDNCAGTVTVSHDADVIAAGSCANRYVITRTYHATDLCGNAAVAVSQTITVDDQTPPVITSVPANVTVSCASLVPPADDSAVVATDNCAGTVTVSHDADVIAAGSCANRYVITRTYHATDLCGNAAVAVSQTITVDDQTPPVITSVPANVTVSCASLVPAADDSAVVATDNCAGAVTVSHDADVIAAGSCANRYVITRTYH